MRGALGPWQLKMWDPYRGKREDWSAIYNLWLLLGEVYRLESLRNGLFVNTGVMGKRRGVIGDLFRFSCFGIWCEIWGQYGLAESARGRARLEAEAIVGSLGPSRSLVWAFLEGKLPADSGQEWVRIRKKFSRGGLQRAEVHNDSFPFDVLAPELAWCLREGLEVPRCSAIVEFPPISREWEIYSVTERALTILAKTWE